MSSNGNKIELPASIVIRDLAQKIEKSPIDLIKKLMTNGVMATINQSLDQETAMLVVWRRYPKPWKSWRRKRSARFPSGVS